MDSQGTVVNSGAIFQEYLAGRAALFAAPRRQNCTAQSSAARNAMRISSQADKAEDVGVFAAAVASPRPGSMGCLLARQGNVHAAGKCTECCRTSVVGRKN